MTAEQEFNEMLNEIISDKPNAKGVRLQKKTQVLDLSAGQFTVTIERGDTLN